MMTSLATQEYPVSDSIDPTQTVFLLKIDICFKYFPKNILYVVNVLR